MFFDRVEAGTFLAEKLLKYQGENAVILAVPRGGLPIGAVIAKKLKLPLEVILTKKLGHPQNKEYAIGAVSLKGLILDNQAADISMEYILKETQKIRTLLSQKREQYYKNRKSPKIKGKIAIIVDDGVATGNTLLATAQLVLEELPSRIIIAIPVGPPSAILKLRSSSFIDEVICLEQPENFHGVGEFYEIFEQVTDAEAIDLLKLKNIEQQ